MSDSKIILALDVNNSRTAKNLVRTLKYWMAGVKVHQLVDIYGRRAVTNIKREGVMCMVDVKLHDTPEAVYARARAYAEVEADFLTVHIGDDLDMLQAAKSGSGRHTKVIGVTELTSNPYARYDLDRNVRENRIVQQALTAIGNGGLDGITCPPDMVSFLRKNPTLGAALFICPGIRLPTDKANNHSNPRGPWETIHNGADYLVVGRPITQASDPLAALAAYQRNIESYGESQ